MRLDVSQTPEQALLAAGDVLKTKVDQASVAQLKEMKATLEKLLDSKDTTWRKWMGPAPNPGDKNWAIEDGAVHVTRCDRRAMWELVKLPVKRISV